MAVDTASNEQFWQRRAAAWERRSGSVEAFSSTFGDRALDLLCPAEGERVLDLGCGPATTLLKIAERVGPTGLVRGVDIASGMIDVARRRVDDSGSSNVELVVADVEAGPPAAGFDAAYSRFGVMFYTDPVAGFSNIADSLREDGRFAFSAWAPLDQNPWMFLVVMYGAQVLGAEPRLPGPNDPGPFSLGEIDRVENVLSEAGFGDVQIETVKAERRINESTADDEISAMLEVGPLTESFEAASPELRRDAINVIVEALEPYKVDGGWSVPGAAHVVAARV